MWNNDEVANPTLPCPEKFGWMTVEDGLVPAMTKLCIPPAPDAITYLVKCKCAKERCSTKRYQCRRALAGLNCTDLCSCSDNGKLCESMHGSDGDDDVMVTMMMMVMMMTMKQGLEGVSVIRKHRVNWRNSSNTVVISELYIHCDA